MAKSFISGHDEGIGKGAPSNMPQEKIHMNYPKQSQYNSGGLDDTITGIDTAVNKSVGKASRFKSNQK